MLIPKRVKHRKQQRGRPTGNAQRGNTIAFGEYGLVCLEPEWLTNRQIEAARIALNRYIKRGGKLWIRIFPDKPYSKPWKPQWERARTNTGWRSCAGMFSSFRRRAQGGRRSHEARGLQTPSEDQFALRAKRMSR